WEGSRALVALLLLLVAPACLQTVVLERPPSDGGLPGSGGGAAGGAGTGGSPGAGGGPWNPGFCANGAFASLSPMPRSPDLVIALDRSSSMSTSRFGATTRLEATQQALRQMVSTYQKTIRFGYEEFPVSSA